MKWFDVDGARDYLAECGFTKTRNGRERRPSRKVLYNMAKAGMKVSRLGATDRRLVFCAEWIDEFLRQRSDPQRPECPEVPIALVRAGGSAG